jgi:hypothetical protein
MFTGMDDSPLDKLTGARIELDDVVGNVDKATDSSIDCIVTVTLPNGVTLGDVITTGAEV